MKILITGSEGFIGRHLCEALKKHTVLKIDKKLRLDVISIEKYLHTSVDLIIHLAAQTSTKYSINNPSSDFNDNAVGTMAVLEYARKYMIPVIYTSSRKVEPNELGQRSPYGVTKYIGELLCQEYRATYGVPIIIDRLGNIYGDDQEGSPEAFWLAWFIKAAKNNMKITVYGFDGDQSRDMLYIDDLTALLIDQVNNFSKYYEKMNDHFEVGGGVQTEVHLNEALEYLEYDNFEYGKKLEGDKKRLVTSQESLDELESINGWKPTIGWKEGIEKVRRAI